jgi:hypothetical protein
MWLSGGGRGCREAETKRLNSRGESRDSRVFFCGKSVALVRGGVSGLSARAVSANSGDG